MARVLQGVGGAMMVPVGRLTVMKIVPRDQYMAAMTFVTLPGQSARCSARRWAGCWWSTPPRHWIFLINIPVGIVGAIATLCLMPNYTMQTRRFDLSGFLLLAAGMATLTLGARRPERARHFPLPRLAGLVAVGLCALLLYLWHARGNARALFSLNLFRNRTFLSRPRRQLRRTHRQRHAAVYDPGVSADRPRLLPLSRRADDDPDGARQHGHEADRGPVVNRFGYRRVLVASTTGPGGGQPAVYV